MMGRSLESHSLAADSTTPDAAESRDLRFPIGRAEPPLRRSRGLDAWCLGLALCAAPASVALTDTLLATAVLFRVISLLRARERIYVPGPFWLWLPRAVL